MAPLFFVLFDVLDLKKYVQDPKKLPDNPKKYAWQSHKRCITNPKKMPDQWPLSGMFSGIFPDIPKKHARQLAVQKSTDQPDNWQAYF